MRGSMNCGQVYKDINVPVAAAAKDRRESGSSGEKGDWIIRSINAVHDAGCRMATIVATK